MATIEQLENNMSKPPRRQQFIIPNQRILDLMDRHKTDSLSLDDYFIKISKTIGKKSN